MVVRAQPYKSIVKRAQSSIWSELIMADFLFPSAMKLGSQIGLSTVWNPEP